MKDFISGLELSKKFYQDIVKNILDDNFPHLKYTVGLFGHGSEVLCHDTNISTDHDWGPRLVLCVSKHDYDKRDKIDNILVKNLPSEFMGHSVKPDNVSDTRKEEADNISQNHRIEITTSENFVKKELGVEAKEELPFPDWLAIPSEHLLGVIRGEIFYDSLGEIKRFRDMFSYYPHDIWLYVLASQWQKIAEEEPYMGRTGDVKDEIGSKVISARLVKHVMELCLTMEKKYIPYIKWLGTEFNMLECSKVLSPLFKELLSSEDWLERERLFSQIYEFIATKHNKLKITKSLQTKTTKFYGRPYLVIQAGEFVQAIREQIHDNEIKKLSTKIGTINQFVDSPGVPHDTEFRNKFKIIYK